MAGTILLGVMESAAPAGGELLGRYGTAVGALWVTAMAAGDLNALIGLGRETITEISPRTQPTAFFSSSPTRSRASPSTTADAAAMPI